MFLGKTRNQKPETRRARARWRSGFWFLVSGLLLVACRQKMAVQPRYDPLEPSDFFADHMASRPRIAGTVARGEVAGAGPAAPAARGGVAVAGPAATGKIGTADVDGYPFAVTDAVMNRGQERFNIY